MILMKISESFARFSSNYLNFSPFCWIFFSLSLWETCTFVSAIAWGTLLQRFNSSSELSIRMSCHASKQPTYPRDSSSKLSQTNKIREKKWSKPKIVSCLLELHQSICHWSEPNPHVHEMWKHRKRIHLHIPFEFLLQFQWRRRFSERG